MSISSIRSNHLPHIFSSGSARAGPQASTDDSLTEVRAANDTTGILPILTIDARPAAISTTQSIARILPNGNYELQVHIADVAH